MQHCPHAPANRQPTCPESGSLPVCCSALQENEPPTAFRVPFPCAVRSRSPVLHAVQHCCDALTPAALSCCLRQCAAIAGLFAAALVNSVVICTEPHSPLQMHWRIPRGARAGKRGWCSPFTRPCRVRVRVARHSGQDDRHTPGVSRRSFSAKPDPAETSLRNRPRRTAFKSVLLCVAIPEAGLSPQSSPGGQHPLDAPRIRVAPAVRAPGAPVFDYRRRAGPFSLRRLGFTGVALRAPR